ncbi:hypothetical protein DB313_05005 (plasmid) [Borrelia turcica IST7]|uniref:Uncharacterized protein n=1 Tax=Borrelia turcica IST7 TaxID=1104446 RepID=A0A386PNL2_9SPIR|nr:hypothetical protein [Borrelia turcica]AYE36858.1 hypothetical protein DB313_05005 [Borrelia turcica IST7]
MRMKKSYLITSVLLSFVSCDLSVLDKTKDVLSEMRGILETDAVKDVASGKARFTVVSETKTSTVGVSKTQGEAGFGNTAVDSSGTRVAGGADYASATGVSSVVEDETGKLTGMGFVEYDTYSARYAPEFGVSGSNSGGIQQVDYASGDTGVTYGGVSEVIEESYSGMSGSISGGSGAMTIEEDTNEDYQDYLDDLAAKEAEKKYNNHITTAKRHVQGIYTYTSRLKEGARVVELCETKSNDTMDLQNLRQNREIAKKKLAEYTKERLEKDLQGLLDQIVEGILHAQASDSDYYFDSYAITTLSELKKPLEALIKEVKSVAETNHEAYRKLISKRYLIEKISGAVPRLQWLLGGRDKYGE